MPLHANNKSDESMKDLIARGDSLVTLSQYEEAFRNYEEGLAIAKKENNPVKIALCFQKMGSIRLLEKNNLPAEMLFKKSIRYDSLSISAANSFHNLALLKRKQTARDSMFYYLQKAIKLFDSLPRTESSYNAYLNAGIIMKNSQDYQNALPLLLKAYQGFSLNGPIKKWASSASAIAQIQNVIGNKEKAFSYYFESLKLRMQIKDTLGISMSYNNIANAYKAKKDYDSALYYYQKSIRLKHSDSRSFGSTLNNIAVIYWLKKEPKKAEKYYLDALQSKKKFRDTASILYTYNELVLVSQTLRKFGQAKSFLDSATLLVGNIKKPEAVYRNYEVSANYYAAIGNYKKAFEYQSKYSHLYQNVFNTKQAEIVQTLQEKFESEKKQKENLKLTVKNHENQRLINQQKAEIKFNTGLAITLGLILLLTACAYFILQQRQKTLKQEQTLVKLQASVKGQETIKQAIGKDLHDIIASSFDGLRLKVLALSGGQKVQEISEEVVQGMEELNHQIRLISHRLSPLDNKIKKYPLTDIINSQLSEFQMYRKIFVQLSQKLPELLNQLTLESQTNFYGILLEALNNIGRHAKATEVFIECTILNDVLHLQIKDNGIGMDNAEKDGIGILNMTQRAELLNGSCHIKSTTNGTEILLVFPIKKHLKK